MEMKTNKPPPLLKVDPTCQNLTFHQNAPHLVCLHLDLHYQVLTPSKSEYSCSEKVFKNKEDNSYF